MFKVKTPQIYTQHTLPVPHEKITYEKKTTIAKHETNN